MNDNSRGGFMSSYLLHVSMCIPVLVFFLLIGEVKTVSRKIDLLRDEVKQLRMVGEELKPLLENHGKEATE